MPKHHDMKGIHLWKPKRLLVKEILSIIFLGAKIRQTKSKYDISYFKLTYIIHSISRISQFPGQKSYIFFSWP